MRWLNRLCACLEPVCATHFAGAAVRVHQEAVDRICPETLKGCHRLCTVVSHMSLGAGRPAAGLVPVVQGVGGGIPKFEPGLRSVEPCVILVQAQVFSPELEPETVGQGAGSLRTSCGVDDRAGELAVRGPGPTVEVVRSAREPGVVDDADLGMDVDRSPGSVLQIEHAEPPGCNAAHHFDGAQLPEPLGWP